eukprot:454816_1
MMIISAMYVHLLWCLILQISLSIDFPDGKYYIQPTHYKSSPNWDWSVDCHGTTKVQQWSNWHKGWNQQFEITKTSDYGWYKIKCRNTDLCWKAYKNGWGWIYLENCDIYDNNQKFKFGPITADNDQFFIDIYNGKTVEIRSTDNNSGEQLHVSTRSSSQYQKWKITPIPLPLYIDIDEGIYYMQPAHSSPNWDWSVDCHSNTKVQQWSNWHKGLNQRFVFTKTSDGWYTIKCKSTDLCWYAYKNGWGWIYQQNCNSNDAKQKFRFGMTNDAIDQFVIINQHRETTVEIRSTDNNAGEQLHLYEQVVGANEFQRFKITPETTGYYPHLNDGIYFIQPASNALYNNWYWSVDCDSTSPKVIQWHNWHRNLNQQFQLTKIPGGWYTITCNNNYKCWGSSGTWISQRSCDITDDGQNFRFLKAYGTTNQFIIGIKHQTETVGIRPTNNNNGEQLHADSERSGNDYQKFKVIPMSSVKTENGILHIGVYYEMSDAADRLQYTGTSTSDLRQSGWPLSVQWYDSSNGQHMIQLRDSTSEITVYFPCSSEIIWHYGGGQLTTALDDKTKWAKVKFYYVSSRFSNPAIRVYVKKYEYKSDELKESKDVQTFYETVKKGLALLNDVHVDVNIHVSVLNNLFGWWNTAP